MKEFKKITTAKAQTMASSTRQLFYEVKQSDKLDALCRIIDFQEELYTIIFCKTKVLVDEIAEKLLNRGYPAEGLHGDLSQAQRNKILGKFRKRHYTILVATDVAARGLDISNLTHVINYSLPQDNESYVHRIGRTGRAGQEGVAITLITSSEFYRINRLEKQLKTTIKKERIPTVDMILSTKKDRIKLKVAQILQKSVNQDYDDLRNQLLAEFDEKTIINGLLHFTFSKELDKKNYRQVEDLFSKSGHHSKRPGNRSPRFRKYKKKY